MVYLMSQATEHSISTRLRDRSESEDFHVYALEWEPDSLRWFLDGVQYHATATGVPTLLII